MNLLEVGLDRLQSVLGTDLDLGLTGEQVLRNRREFGENILFEKKNTASDLIKKIFGDIMMILFLLVSFFDYLENRNLSSLAAILAVVFLYSSFVLGTHVYVSRVKKKVEKFSRSKYHVRRAGKVISVAKSELVPGDLLLLEKGDIMPCDGIILKHGALKILEASVTGRRVPVFKRSHEEVEDQESGYPYFECILFAGSVILHGNAKVIVCNTGRDIFDNQNFTISRQNTTIPRIYETAMDLKRQISLVWVLVCFFLFAFGVFRGQNAFGTFHYVTAMVIAAFPDAMEHLSDFAIAYMTGKLFERGVVLRNPGVVDRLCDANCVFVNSSDYLFYSHPLANAYYLGDEIYDFKEEPKMAAPLLENLLLAQSKREYYLGRREEWKAERALLSAAASIGLQKRRLDKEFLSINRYDFDLRRGYSCALVMKEGSYRLIIRGNPNLVLPCCGQMEKGGERYPLTRPLRDAIRANARHLAGMCERIFAVAVLEIASPSTGDQRSLCRDMVYLGMFGLTTPISADSAKAVNTCQKSGIQTYLLTDDYPETVSALSKSVSIIGEGDHQYALSFQTYERMDRGVFVADIEKYKAFCGFPAEEKQSIVKYHKDNGDITISLTGGLYDTLPQMESDISVVDVEEKQNAVRQNADVLVKEKKYELVPLCINWARILYRNIVHIMQYALLIQIALMLSVFIGFAADGSAPFALLPMVLMGLGVCIPAGMNIFHRLPGPRLEDNKGAIQDDRVASLQVLLVNPMIAGTTQALCVMLSRQIARYASGSDTVGSGAALITFIFSSYFVSLVMKFDHSLFSHLKDIGRCGLITFLSSALFAALFTVTPLTRLWLGEATGSGYSFWILLFAILLSILPSGMLEWMKALKKDDDSAIVRES